MSSALKRDVYGVPYPDGPWNSEPDRVEFRVAGLPCLILRGPVGGLCGYAAVPPGHPLWGADYDSASVDVHGGLTYSGSCQGHICHKPRTGEPHDVWWFGFDCAHLYDLVPGMLRIGLNIENGVYRDLAYVRDEVTSLATQLSVIGRRGGSWVCSNCHRAIANGPYLRRRLKRHKALHADDWADIVYVI